jgi:polysaccharide pyruvyl transferase CsaB
MKALLLGYYGQGNLGDDLMLSCLSTWLSDQGVSITVGSENPQGVTAPCGRPVVQNVPLLGEWEWRSTWLHGGAARLLSAMRRHDLIILGGGDLIRDDHGWRTFAFSIEKIAAARLLGKPVALLNVGIGTPSTAYGRATLGWALRQCARVIVRDQRSVDVCAEAGVEAVFLPDIVLTLPSSVPAHTDNRLPYIAVCMRDGWCSMSEFQIGTLASILDGISERTGLQTAFIPFQKGIDEADYGLHQRLAHKMRTACQVFQWSGDIPELVSRISNATAVLAMRLHASVMAVAYEKPCVAIPYDHKIREFARLAGVPLLELSALNDFHHSMAIVERGFRTPAVHVDTSGWRTQRILD